LDGQANLNLNEREDENERVLSSVALSDGRVIRFDPLALDKKQVEGELSQGGLSEGERKEVAEKIRLEVVKALAEKMDVWKI
jgi:hypothetical protein